MSDQPSATAGLKSSIEALMGRCDQLASEKAQLNVRLDELQQKLENQQGDLAKQRQEFAELKESSKVMKMARSITSETGGKSGEAKLKINDLVREIDKCIALLNK